METILFCKENRTSNTFFRDCFRKMLVEKKIRDRVTRFRSYLSFRSMEFALVFSILS